MHYSLDENPTLDAISEPARAKTGAAAKALIAFAIALNLAIVLAAVVIATNPQRVTDQFTVWQFEPSGTLAQYAARTTMTEEGQFLFYASTPQISTEESFDNICSTRTEDVGILGCYLPDEQSIFLYDVTDARLDGLEEVVAAHELLHAVWDRMSRSDREKLAPLLEAEAAARADDEEFAATLAFYAETEPGERLNELHSIVGTEFSAISAGLEQHFSRYFVDRASIVALHETSKQIFDEQAAAAEDLTEQIDALVTSVDADSIVYNSGYDALNADIDDFNARAESGDFDSQADFDAERAALLSRQAGLDALYASIDARADQYDLLVAQLEQLNVAIAELNKSINIAPRAEPSL